MTRTALKRKNLSSRVPLRSTRQGAKALSKQRSKTGTGLNEYEVTEVKGVDKND
jgi:hypothetical protein